MPSNPEQRKLLRFLTKVVKEKCGISCGMSNSIIEAHCLSTARDLLKKCTLADILLCKASTAPAFVTAELLASSYFPGSSCLSPLSVATTGDQGSTGLPASSSGASPGTPRAAPSSTTAHAEGPSVDGAGVRAADTPSAVFSSPTVHSDRLLVDTTSGRDAEGTLSPALRKIKSKEAALCRFISTRSEDTPTIGRLLLFGTAAAVFGTSVLVDAFLCVLRCFGCV